MASIISRRPLLTSATAATVLATGYYLSSSRRPIMMDSAQTPLAHTLSMPKNMIFSKQLKVTDVQQVNHDTKRIIFALPGGNSEVSGVTPGGMCQTQ
jgi:cytochrome-b5 reductase